MCLLIDDQQVEQVSQFKYLGSWTSDDGYATKDIRARIAIDKTLFMDKKMLTGKLNYEQKKQLIKILQSTV